MRIISANLGHRTERTLDALAMLAPDVLCVQEARSDPDWIRGLETELGMRAWVTPNPNNSKLCTGILVREAVFVDEPQLYPHAWSWHIPPTDLTIRLVDEPNTPWTVISTHHAYHSPHLRVLEAEDLLRAVDAAGRFGRQLVIAGDMNELPRRRFDGNVPDIDWGAVTDLAHRRHRAHHINGTWFSATAVDDTLIDAGLVDAAVFVADRFDRPRVSATAGFDRPDQGGEARIDRIYLTDSLADKLYDCLVIDVGSDHQSVLIDLSN